MAKIDLKFLDFIDEENYIKAEIENVEYGSPYVSNIFADLIRIEVCFENNLNILHLDKSTAIKFAKTLRTEINKIVE